jgi:hypothetical protein
MEYPMPWWTYFVTQYSKDAAELFDFQRLA